MGKNFDSLNIDPKIADVLSSERIPHAILLCGPSGIGKLVQAIKLAKYLVCTNGSNGQSCETCPSCKKASKYIHPDIHFTFPTIGKDGIADNFLKEWRSLLSQNPFSDLSDWLKHIGAEKKQGNIPKAECLNILKKINLKAFEGGNKVSIIWLPEFLGGEGNRLLKLIEEPPANSYFILVTNNAENILGTIHSRCQLIKLSPPPKEEIKSVLQSFKNMEDAQLESIINISNGNINKALSLMETETNEHFELLQKVLRASYKGNASDLCQIGENLSSLPKQSLKSFLEYFLHFVRQCMLFEYIQKDKIQLNNKELIFAENFYKNLDADSTAILSKEVSDKIYHIERNANTRLTMTNLCIKLHKLMKSRREVLA